MITLQIGDVSEEVRDLQSRLNRLGYALAEDGIFGKLTQAAVIDFQLRHNLIPYGIVGKNTGTAIDEAILRLQPQESSYPDTPASAVDLADGAPTPSLQTMTAASDTMVYRDPDIYEIRERLIFKDLVTPSNQLHWAAKFVEYVAGLGIVTGYPSGAFNPDLPITRAEAVKVVCEALITFGLLKSEDIEAVYDRITEKVPVPQEKSLGEKVLDLAVTRLGMGYAWGTQGEILTEAFLAELKRKFGASHYDLPNVSASRWIGYQVFDCSGLIVWCLRNLGAIAQNADYTTNGLYRFCKVLAK